MRTAGLLIGAALLPFVAYAATININSATAAELDALPGIGPTKAAAIVEYRTKNGPFTTIEDIQKVSGIGPVTFANIQSSITVGTTSASAPAPAQPQASSTSYQKIQAVEPPAVSKVEPITSPTNVPYEQAVAPATTTEIVGAGAALPPADPELQTQSSRSAGLFSVWTLGLAGVILVAGGAFIFL